MSSHITSGSVDSGFLAEKGGHVAYLPNRGSIVSLRSSNNSPTSKVSAKYWAKMLKSNKIPMSSQYQHRTKISSSMGSVSSGSIVSPISSEGLFEEFGYYNNLMGGRSLDQLYKTSIDVENDSPEHNILKKEIQELKAQLKKTDDEKLNIIHEYNKKLQAIQNEATVRSEAAKESQVKQAHLVERLQDKVAYYKDQCKEM